MKKFMMEGRGEADIEYVLIFSGVIFTAVIVFMMYSNMTRGVVAQLNESVGGVASNLTAAIDALDL